MTVPDEFIRSPAQESVHGCIACPAQLCYMCVRVCVLYLRRMHTLLYASSTRTSTNVNASSSGGRHIEASQAHCIALHPTSRGCGGLPAFCPVPAPTGCNHKCCECNIAEARASTKTYNMATPRVEASHSMSRPERHGGEDASSSAPHCSLEAASHLPIPPLAAIRGHGPRVTIAPWLVQAVSRRLSSIRLTTPETAQCGDHCRAGVPLHVGPISVRPEQRGGAQHCSYGLGSLLAMWLSANHIPRHPHPGETGSKRGR